MLASAGAPPSGPGWAFEFKWDGVRAIAAVAGEALRLYSRTGGYPELATLSGLTKGRRVLLDGEIVTLGAAGRPDFGLLQQRMHVRSPSPELVARVPISYYLFDLLDLDGHRLLAQSYQQRRELLASLDLDRGAPLIRVPPNYTDIGDGSGASGGQLLEVARQQGAKAWELRTATSLTRLWGLQGRTREGVDLLASLYGSFGEGFDTPVLVDAKVLLDALA